MKMFAMVLSFVVLSACGSHTDESVTTSAVAAASNSPQAIFAEVANLLQKQTQFGDFSVEKTYPQEGKIVAFQLLISNVLIQRTWNSVGGRNYFVRPYFSTHQLSYGLTAEQSTNRAGQTVYTLTDVNSIPMGNVVIPNATPVSVRLTLTVSTDKHIQSARLQSWYKPTELGISYWTWREAYDVSWK